MARPPPHGHGRPGSRTLPYRPAGCHRAGTGRDSKSRPGQDDRRRLGKTAGCQCNREVTAGHGWPPTGVTITTEGLAPVLTGGGSGTRTSDRRSSSTPQWKAHPQGSRWFNMDKSRPAGSRPAFVFYRHVFTPHPPLFIRSGLSWLTD